MRGFTRAVYDRMDLRSTGMEFASEFVIKAAQLQREDHGNSDHAVAGQARTSAASAKFSRWVAASAVHAAVCAELVVSFAWRVARGGGIVSGVLAAAGTANSDAAHDAGRAHDDFWRDVYVARRADSVDWRVRQSVQLRGAIRSPKYFAAARADPRDAGNRVAARRRIVSDRDLRVAPGWFGIGWPADSDRCTRCARCCSGRCGYFSGFR